MVFKSPTTEHAVNHQRGLTALLEQEADRRGSISFARFMELALYAPRLGYYEQDGREIGRRGDFITSVSVGPLFGELLACQFSRWLENLGSSTPVIVEAGAHDGRLAHDILCTLRDLRCPNVQYWLLEPSPTRQQRQQATLAGLEGQVRWFQSWTALSSFCEERGRGLEGIVFANELLDALPVHRLQWNRAGRRWCELGVAKGEGGWAWRTLPPGPELEAYGRLISTWCRDNPDIVAWPCLPEPLLDVLPDGFITEVCPEAVAWWQSAARTLARGWLLTMDYGLDAAEFFQPHRGRGTVRAYHQHRMSDEVLARPGEQDLTAHVNLGVVRLAGEATGLVTEACLSQADFLTGALRSAHALSGRTLNSGQVRSFHTLTHPHGLGRAFRVLMQRRDPGGAPSVHIEAPPTR